MSEGLVSGLFLAHFWIQFTLIPFITSISHLLTDNTLSVDFLHDFCLVENENCEASVVFSKPLFMVAMMLMMMILIMMIITTPHVFLGIITKRKFCVGH